MSRVADLDKRRTRGVPGCDTMIGCEPVDVYSRDSVSASPFSLELLLAATAPDVLFLRWSTLTEKGPLQLLSAGLGSAPN